MSTLINEIDARTRLAVREPDGAIAVEVGDQRNLGINVFKVREVMKLPGLNKFRRRIIAL